MRPALDRLRNQDAHDDVIASAHTEIYTILQEIYRINHIGGSGSRKRVSELLIRLGVRPNIDVTM